MAFEHVTDERLRQAIQNAIAKRTTRARTGIDFYHCLQTTDGADETLPDERLIIVGDDSDDFYCLPLDSKTLREELEKLLRDDTATTERTD